MLAVDTNILVYAYRLEYVENEHAYEVVQNLVLGDESWAIPWPCAFEFLNVVTNRRIWKEAASPTAQAWKQLRAWEASPSCRMIGETNGFMDVLEGFVNRPNITGAIVHDARIAAICMANGVETLLTRDRDFSLFPLLHTRDPLLGRP
ncbi:MAG: PIN domain-containing protein [bacterium]|nr:PIN domain-containing protein [bacterium]